MVSICGKLPRPLGAWHHRSIPIVKLALVAIFIASFSRDRCIRARLFRGPEHSRVDNTAELKRKRTNVWDTRRIVFSWEATFSLRNDKFDAEQPSFRNESALLMSSLSFPRRSHRRAATPYETTVRNSFRDVNTWSSGGGVLYGNVTALDMHYSTLTFLA